jgi:hypothetical protein
MSDAKASTNVENVSVAIDMHVPAIAITELLE